MTFLQPWLLWALPLVLLPVLIHLFNRLRHRSMPWAAMMFLRSATRKSTRYARLRQFLVLMFRVLAVLGLILALSRPLAGGWAGWMFSSAPDAIVMLLDRSASMETREGPGGVPQVSKRQQAVQLLSQAAAKYQEATRLVVLDNTSRTPQEIAEAALLSDLPTAEGSDTAADIPGMLQNALDWMSQAKPGSAEIWLASDLQESNWDSRSERWAAVASGLAALPQRVRLRLLALNSEPAANHSVRVLETNRRSDRSDLELVIDLERTTTGPATVPVSINLDGVRTQIEMRMDGPTLRYRHRMPMGPKNAGGWGYVELPSDSNLRDNRSYFVYSGPGSIRAGVVAIEPAAARLLQIAAAPDPKNTNQVSEVLSTNGLESANLDNFAMVLWQAPLPEGAVATRLRAFVEAGGTILFFPSGERGQFAEVGWGEPENAQAEKPFRVSRWEERDGPLAKTEEGLSLPVGELVVLKRQSIVGDAGVLASFEDGSPFLSRRTVGKGQVLFCATQPGKDWSQLYEGIVLVPMLQRLMEAGARRFATAASVECGEWQPPENERWMEVSTKYPSTQVPKYPSTQGNSDAQAPNNPSTQAGIYRSGGQLVALNRPAREDERDLVEPARAKALLNPMPVSLFDEKQSGAARLQSELWRLFLVIMAVCLVVEGFLILPEKPERVRQLESQVSTQIPNYPSTQGNLNAQARNAEKKVEVTTILVALGSLGPWVIGSLGLWLLGSLGIS